jgi:alcohol dehydrogenase class IV
MVTLSFVENGIFHLYTPTQIYFGYGCFDAGIARAKDFGSKAIIVIGKGSAKKLGYLQRLEDALAQQEIDYCVVEGIPENPDEETVENAVEKVKEFEPDFFVALGGGSVIDATKAINAVYSNGLSVKECYTKPIRKVLPLIAIPTTAGTGSEVTRYAVITDLEEKTKKIIADYKICPTVAIVDPEFTLKLPKSITIASGLDALSHCIEALLGYYSNPIIDAVALKGVEIGIRYLPIVATNPDRESRLYMMLCSLIGGIAINTVPTGLAHAMSYSLTSYFGIPHGIAVAMVLPYVMELMNYEEKLQMISKVVGGNAIEIIQKINESLGVPSHVEGLTEELCERFAEQVVQNKAKLRNNIRIPTFEEVKSIYMKFL